jgi:VWFA-related protein
LGSTYLYSAVTLALLMIGATAGAQTQAPRFRGGIDLVTIDVTVLDRSGEPVRDLRPEDFTVFIANRPRAIQSVDFIASDAVNAASAPSPAREAGVSTNTLPTSGRLLLLVVDEANLQPTSAHAVMHAAESLIAGLSRGDLVGLARFPDGGGIEFTVDHARVLGAIRQVKGRPASRSGMGVEVFLSEAVDFEQGGRDQWPRALLRECGNPQDPTYRLCQKTMELEAAALLRGEAQKTRMTVDGLRALMKGLEDATTAVTVVLISEGLFVANDAGALAGLASSDGNARVALHVVRPRPPMVSMTIKGPSIDPSGDDAFRRVGLEMLAAQFRGSFYEMSGTGESIFARIQKELSGYYLLSVESTATDREGGNRRVRVEVKRADVVVTARSAFPRRAPATADARAPEERLREMLESLVPTRGLAVAVTSRILPDAADDRVRVLISAEIGHSVAQAASVHVGLVVVDRLGAAVTSNAGTLILAPSHAGRPSPALFSTSLVLAPGEYSLRLAAIDTTGAAGSAHHDVDARLTTLSDGRQVSDLIVSAEPGAGQFPLFTPAAVVDGRRVASVVEVRDPRGRPPDGAVKFEVTVAGQGAPLVAVDAHAQLKPGEKTTMFSRVLSLDDLRSGEYLLRATLTVDGDTKVIGERAFRLEPDPLLARDNIRRAVDELQRVSPVSDELQAFVDAAKAGVFVEPPDAESRSKADVAMVTFVSGLKALVDGRAAVARALFAQTSRSAPNFTGIGPFLSRAR